MIALRLGRTRNSALQHRRILSIPPMPRIFPNGWTAQEAALFGRIPDAEIPKRIHRSVQAVGHPVGSVSVRRRQLKLNDPSR
jgi:hypothetical protein